MRVFDFLASDKLTPLAETLLHSLWQGALIAFLLYLQLKTVPARRARLRYASGIGALLAMFIGAFLTWAYIAHEQNESRGSISETTVMAQSVQHNSASIREGGQANRHLDAPLTEATTRRGPQSLLIFLWIVGVDIMLIRLSLALADLEDLRQNSRPPSDSVLAKQYESLRRRSKSPLQRITILVADKLTSPVAFGFLRPTIVIPASLVTQSPPLLLEAILAHELAHIRRHDYLVNLGQLVIETLLFFNPAVWWISHQIRSEREACCDAEAVRLMGSETDYAEALADYAENAPQTVLASALPFGQERSGGKLLDRIRRLLIPGYQPTLKLPVGAITLFFAISAVVLVGLHQGSKMAIAVGAEWLSPEVRIAKIKAIQESYPIFNQEYQYDAELAQQPGSRVQLSGTIVTEDGSPLLTKGLTLQADSQRPGYGASHALGFNDGSFSGNVRPGELFLSAYSPHYAPSLLGPFRGEIAGVITNLSFKMKKGFTGQIRIENEKGVAIPDAELYGSYDFASYAAIPETQSDTNGIALLTNLITHPMKLRLRAKGYQEDHQTITLHDTSITNWTLIPAVPTTVTVIDVDGAPITNATAKLVRTEGLSNMSYGVGSGRVYARSNPLGQLTFTELRDDSRYWFGISADGFGNGIVRGLSPGVEGLRLTLEPPLVVHGIIEGDLSLLKKRSRNVNGERQKLPIIEYRNPFEIEGYTDSNNHSVYVDMDAERATFVIEDLWQGEITITAGSKSVTHQLTQSPNEVRIRLDAEEETDPLVVELFEPLATREVHLHLDTPSGQPAANGPVKVNVSAKKPNGGYDYQELSLQVENGLARLSANVGSRVGVEPDSFPGYWFTSTSIGDVPIGSGPLELNLACYPAGAIYGKVQEANGDPALAAMISIVEVTPAPERPNGSLDIDIKNSSSSQERTETFNATPLPIGGTYMIVAHRGNSYAVSPHLTITGENPIQETGLVMRPGVTVRGQVFQANGEPAAGIRFSHSYNPVPNHGFSTSDAITDRLGRFVIRDVTQNLPGTYSIRFRKNPGFQGYEIVYEVSETPLVVKLKTGAHLEGRVVDAETGWPIPGLEMYVLPRPYSTDRSGHIDADEKTDETGRFKFTTLDSGAYEMNARGANLANRDQKLINGGDTLSSDLRVTLSQWSKLKPTPPVSEIR